MDPFNRSEKSLIYRSALKHNLNDNNINSYSSTTLKREEEHEGNLAAVQNRCTATCNKQEDSGQGGPRMMLTQKQFLVRLLRCAISSDQVGSLDGMPNLNLVASCEMRSTPLLLLFSLVARCSAQARVNAGERGVQLR